MPNDTTDVTEPREISTSRVPKDVHKVPSCLPDYRPEIAAEVDDGYQTLNPTVERIWVDS